MRRGARLPDRALPLLVLTAALSLLAACSDPVDPPPSAVPTQFPVLATPETGGSGTPPPTLGEADIERLLREAVCWYDDPALASLCLPPGEEAVAALETMAFSGDERFVAPLVDMLWLDAGWARFVTAALERLTGVRHPSPEAWYAWLADEQPALPPGYATWKGRLLGLIDPDFASLLNDGQLAAGGIGASALIWDRVEVDGYPPLDRPPVLLRAEQQYLAVSDVVFGVFLGDEVRAYPERVVAWHGVVRDEVGGVALTLVHCTPCGGVAAYAAFASDGQRYTLGNSGLVYHSRRLLYDQETHSLWDPVSGLAVAGPLATTGVSLQPLPVLRTSWGEWGQRHPNSGVLSLDTGFVRDYDAGVATGAEQAGASPQYPTPPVDPRLGAKTPVLGLTIGGEVRAYPVAAVESAGIVADTLGGQSIVLVSLGPGTGVTVYRADDVRFTGIGGTRDALELVDAEGLRWFMDERSLVNSRNSRVRESLPSRTAYWFAWSGAHPGTDVWTAP
ncbi:MAG: DUF3179 domain-containing protein [Dehalococcoidia bacterium]|nr:DUF3179 domain-containing protein [Dehalococcoidia bacterium]